MEVEEREDGDADDGAQHGLRDVLEEARGGAQHEGDEERGDDVGKGRLDADLFGLGVVCVCVLGLRSLEAVASMMKVSENTSPQIIHMTTTAYLVFERRAREGPPRGVGLEKRREEAAEAQGPQFLRHVERVLVHEGVLPPDGDRLEVGQQRDGDGGHEHL